MGLSNMGCFSYICKKCGTPINADIGVGEKCIIFLLDKGVVVEQMQGRYDMYGRVIDENGATHEWGYKEWNELCDMQFDEDEGTGFAVFHSACYDGVLPTTKSGDDENQGFGEVREEYC